ncbi:hypothetical protein [Robiginitalea biformata]|uniref:Short chain dehydrogenase n=1 Tax=Robiginitalea biformata (strain ATCC BAA-864 / DSM 15991 / KCTC 12146 / HTCC2501) TaxID=313596 RepID=A4CIG5_ROBBH|nr:hypothetical protein [Robiginitalea biformata]EAR16723.1 short chain dehydrogenase [Robiginitalea biformata HTCC2501]
MRKILVCTLLFFYYPSFSQTLTDESDKEELTYVLSNIQRTVEGHKSIFDGAFYFRVYQIWDSRGTPEGTFPGSEEAYSAYYIAVSPDGDYYVGAELFKVGGLIAPEWLGIEPQQYPEVKIRFRHGPHNQRKVVEYVLRPEIR